MIDFINITDFQGIRHLSIPCGLVTVLVGESDVGKSAVVRALYALAHNDYPSDHVRDGAQFSRVSVTIGDTVVTAEKGTGHNGYQLAVGGGPAALSGGVWDRVGRDVPEQVAAVLGWRVLELDDGTKFVPNISRQFDPPFLLTESPMRAAKMLGSLTNVSRLYAAIREGSLWEQRSRRRRTELETQAHQIEGEIEGMLEGLENRFDWLSSLRVRAKAAVESEWLAERYRSWADQLGQLSGVYRELSEKVSALESRVAVDLEGVTEAAQQAAGWRDLLDRVFAAEKDLQATRVAYGVAEDHLAETSVELGVFVSDLGVCPVCGQEIH